MKIISKSGVSVASHGRKERDEYLEAHNQEYKDIDSVDKNKKNSLEDEERDALEKFHDEIINKYNLQ